MLLGSIFHLTTPQYTLLSIPIMLIFQLGIQRQSLLTLWVRSGPPLRIDVQFIILWLIFSIVPIYDMLNASSRGDLWNALADGAAIIGAFGLAYALRAMQAATARQIGLCLLTAGGIALLLSLLLLLLPHILHVHISGQPAVTKAPSFLMILQAGLGRFLLGPIGFVVEEVLFRGALDTYLHLGEPGTGWWSAIFVSALWGLWHLPDAANPAQWGYIPHFFSTMVGLLVAQIAVGVPLSLWWRKSGNLVVTDTTHAFLEALRSVLAALM